MVDRIGGALGQQWLQRLIDEAVRQAKPTDRSQGAPPSLAARLAGPDTLIGGGLGAVGDLKRRADEFGAQPLPAAGIQDAIAGLFGGGPAPAPSVAGPQGVPASLMGAGQGAPGALGAQAITPGGAAAGGLAPSTSAPVSVTQPIVGAGMGARAGATGAPGAATGGIGGIAPGGVGAPGSLLDGGFGGGLAQEQTIAELLDNPSFAVQDMLRDRGINPGRNSYAAGIYNKYKDIFGALSGLAMGQAGVGPSSTAADTATAYNTFLNSFMGGTLDKAGIVRTAMASAEADPSGQMASLIRDLGPGGMAQLIAGLGGQGKMLGQAQERMLNERAIEARRKRQALMETNPQAGVTEDDLSYLQSFRGAI